MVMCGRSKPLLALLVVTIVTAPVRATGPIGRFHVSAAAGDDANPVTFPSAFTVTNTPTLDIAAASEFEGNSGETPLSFALTLSSPAPAGGLRVLATTLDGSATEGTDYVSLNESEFTIAAGESTTNVVVQMIGDTTDEPDETLTVTLLLPDGGAVFGASVGIATGTIRNDDASTAVLSIAPAADVAEGIAFYRELLGLEHLTVFPHLVGDPYAKADEQMARFAEEVLPLVG